MPSSQPLQLSVWTVGLVMKTYKDKEEREMLELHILGLQCLKMSACVDFTVAAGGSRRLINVNLNHNLRS